MPVGCVPVGDCPFGLYGHDPAVHYNYRDFGPLWLDGASRFEPVAAGVPASLTRRAVKCRQVWRIDPYTRIPLPHGCIRSEVNVGGAYGDCLKFELTVEAVVPGAASRWSYRTEGCHNRYGAVTDSWVAPDAVCESSQGRWHASGYLGLPPQPVSDTGEWTVTLGALTAPGGTLGLGSGPYVDVPLEVEVADWGDVSHLLVTVTATPRRPVWVGGESTYRIDWRAQSGSLAPTATTVTVPRRSGSPPSDDVIEVNIAETAQLPYSSTRRYNPNSRTWHTRIDNDRFVEVLRSEMLSNDACPTGVDCADPTQWPVRITGDHATLCNPRAFEQSSSAYAMQSTSQGLVGCDDLDDTGDPASVRYWPRLWAAGTDTFAYSTYGGTATVTVRFTDTAPVAPPVVAYDGGTPHDVGVFGTPVERSTTICAAFDLYGSCRRHRTDYFVDYIRSGPGFAASRYSAAVALTAVRDSDPDGDAARIEIIGAHNPHLAGQAAATAGGRHSFWRLDETSPADCNPTVFVTLCGQTSALFASFVRLGHQVPVNPTDGASASPRGDCVSHTDTTVTDTITYSQAYWNSYPDSVAAWSSTAGTDPGCVPSMPAGCDAATILDWSMCYSLWPNTAGPQPLVVDYRACDRRLDAFEDDRSAALAAGRSPADYCSDGDVTVALGCGRPLSDTQRSRLAGEVGWHTLVGIGPAGGPGETWPPHPEVPGGHEHLVVAGSPVWPRIDNATALDFSDDSGCDWRADWLQTRAIQMLPWNPAHRAAVEADGRFASWLGIWDNLDAGQQVRARRDHMDADFASPRCGAAAAADATSPVEHNDSYIRCRWELPRAGVWGWQLAASFTSAGAGHSREEVLAEATTWFLGFAGYTDQITLHGGTAAIEPGTGGD